ncbi:MAG: primosomal protein N' [Alphaproteobacteria bacterium]|nr:primosomal protein N' [Alphaproteobacteria bacterium]
MRADSRSPESLFDDAETPSTVIVDVLIPLALDIAYSYKVPTGLTLAVGDVVHVPLAARETIGVVWETRTGAATSNLKAVIGKADAPSLRPHLREFVDWVARYTLAPRGLVLRMVLRAPEIERNERIAMGVRLVGAPPQRMTPARQRVLAILDDGLLRSKRDLCDKAGVSAAVIDGLIDEGTLVPEPMPKAPVAPLPDPDFTKTIFSEAQSQAVDALIHAAQQNTSSILLLEGVTGSGKTEVYFEAVAETLRSGRQSLILMPEIALTGQFLDRFEKRFGVRPAEWHSGISGRRREKIFAALASGEAKVIAGARSALFLPYANLGLIIVDEEHETAYKQEDGVNYHARDMAVVRGRLENAPVILASATPSIESRVNAKARRYLYVKLPERHGGRAMPVIATIDMREDAPAKTKFLSPRLVGEIKETIARGEQALLYLNRRGYAPLTLCRHCGHRFQCPNCTTWLVEHRFRRALMCHHCGHVERRPETCPSCSTEDSLAACGPGVERLQEEVAEQFSEARALVLSSDMPGGIERLRREIEAVASGEFSIVIGTQLIAKGHHFPYLSLVGVVDADLGLTSGDPRAAERTFQMLGQVTGRAGRGHTAGRALLQSYDPEHPVIRALVSGDAERFYREEIAQREAAGLPPFGRLASLIISANERLPAESHARALKRVADPPAGVTVLGPAEAPIAVIRGRHRFRILVKTERSVPFQIYLKEWLARAPKPTGNVRVEVDIDPQSFY